MGKEKVVFVDVNIFLEVVLEQEKIESCKVFLNLLKNGDVKAMISDYLLYACLLQIQYQLKLVQITI